MHGCRDNLGFPRERLAGIAEIQIVSNRKVPIRWTWNKSYHIIKFLCIKGLRLGETVKKLSSADGPDAYTPPSINYWLHQIMLGRTDLRTQRAGGDDISTILMPKFYHFSENIHSLQCERLLSPWRFLLRQFILVWLRNLV
jgi:hypothetical protein